MRKSYNFWSKVKVTESADNKLTFVQHNDGTKSLINIPPCKKQQVIRPGKVAYTLNGETPLEALKNIQKQQESKK